MLRPHKAPASGSDLYGLAERLTVKCQYLMDSVHRNPQKGADIREGFIGTDKANVRPVLVKKAETGDGMILRLLETDGLDTEATLRIGENTFPITLGHYAIETFRFEAGKLQRVNLLEEPQD